MDFILSSSHFSTVHCEVSCNSILARGGALTCLLFSGVSGILATARTQRLSQSGVPNRSLLQREEREPATAADYDAQGA